MSYEPYLCNGCHDVMLMQIATIFTDVAIVSIKGSDYRIYFWYMSKDDVINIMNNSNLNKKGPYCNFLFCYYYVKMSQNTYQRNRDMILNREQKIIMEMIKERLREEVWVINRNLHLEDKNER